MTEINRRALIGTLAAGVAASGASAQNSGACAADQTLVRHQKGG